jgi:hypothetical protein
MKYQMAKYPELKYKNTNCLKLKFRKKWDEWDEISVRKRSYAEMSEDKWPELKYQKTKCL